MRCGGLLTLSQRNGCKGGKPISSFSKAFSSSSSSLASRDLHIKQLFVLVIYFFFVTLQIPPYIVEVVRVLPLVTFPLVYFMKGEKTDDEMWVAIGVLLFFIMLGILTIFSVLRTGRENPRTMERLTRYGVAPVSPS